MKTNDLSFEEANALFRYDPETGCVMWRVKPSNAVNVGDMVGTLTDSGYLRVRVNGLSYYVHRVAYTLFHGEVPERAQVDHINHIRTDNSIINLRAVSPTDNSRNASKRKDSSTGVTGVTYHKKRKRFAASISVNGKRVHVGYFNTLEEAAAAREKANKDYGFHRNHGK